MQDQLVKSIEATANMMRGMLLDPSIPTHAKEALGSKITELDSLSNEAAVLPFDKLSFGQAIEAAKQGQKIARKGWNGADMFVVYMPPQTIPAEKISEHTATYVGRDKPLNLQPYFAMYNAQEQWIPGWLASQSDMLSDDWMIVE